MPELDDVSGLAHHEEMLPVHRPEQIWVGEGKSGGMYGINGAKRLSTGNAISSCNNNPIPACRVDTIVHAGHQSSQLTPASSTHLLSLISQQVICTHLNPRGTGLAAAAALNP